MSQSNAVALSALYKAPYNRSMGESTDKPYANINQTYEQFMRRASCAPGERFAVPNTNIVVRWVRVRGSGVVAGMPLTRYVARTGTSTAGTATTITTGSTLPITDVGSAIFSTLAGTGPNQFRTIKDSDGATNASKLTLVEPDNTNYYADASLPEALSPVPDATTTWGIYAPWEVAPHTASASVPITCVALGTVTDGNFTMVVEQGVVPVNCVGSTDALVANGLVVPSATAGAAKGVTTAGITATDAAYFFGIALNAYAGAAALRLVDLIGRFKQ